MCLVFETLGKSLYEFIKANKYYGYSLKTISRIGKQMLEGVLFLHEKMGLTHTDLKPENILLKYETRKRERDQSKFPINVLNKSQMYDGQVFSDSESE